MFRIIPANPRALRCFIHRRSQRLAHLRRHHLRERFLLILQNRGGLQHPLCTLRKGCMAIGCKCLYGFLEFCFNGRAAQRVKRLDHLPRCRVDCGDRHGWPPQRYLAQMIGPFGRIRLEESQLVLPTYQIGPFLYTPSIDIYDSSNLIVDTSPRKVVQGSYLFTVALAFAPLGSRDMPSRALATARSPRSLSPEPGTRRAQSKEPRMKRKKAARPPQAQSDARQDSRENLSAPSRRSFLRTAAGAGLALASSPLSALADHHGHPSPNSISYLDRRMYIRNMEVLAHIGPGESRHGKMQMMSAGDRRYIFQQGDVLAVSDVRKPVMFNKGGFEGYQVQVAYNKG